MVGVGVPPSLIHYTHRKRQPKASRRRRPTTTHKNANRVYKIVYRRGGGGWSKTGRGVTCCGRCVFSKCALNYRAEAASSAAVRWVIMKVKIFKDRASLYE